MSKKLLKKENLKDLTHDDLIKLGAATVVGHLANDLEASEPKREDENE
jgi:hypothetical protein